MCWLRASCHLFIVHRVPWHCRGFIALFTVSDVHYPPWLLRLVRDTWAIGLQTTTLALAAIWWGSLVRTRAQCDMLIPGRYRSGHSNETHLGRGTKSLIPPFFVFPSWLGSDSWSQDKCAVNINISNHREVSLSPSTLSPLSSHFSVDTTYLLSTIYITLLQPHTETIKDGPLSEYHLHFSPERQIRVCPGTLSNPFVHKTLIVEFSTQSDKY